jgi:hypothetical protein
MAEYKLKPIENIAFFKKETNDALVDAELEVVETIASYSEKYPDEPPMMDEMTYATAVMNKFCKKLRHRIPSDSFSYHAALANETIVWEWLRARAEASKSKELETAPSDEIKISNLSLQNQFDFKADDLASEMLALQLQDDFEREAKCVQEQIDADAAIALEYLREAKRVEEQVAADAAFARTLQA